MENGTKEREREQSVMSLSNLSPSTAFKVEISAEQFEKTEQDDKL